RPLVQRVLVGVLDGIVRLVQPMMPFLAESLWQALAETAPARGLPTPEKAGDSVVIASWPAYPSAWQDAATEKRIGRMQQLVRAVREVCNRYMIDMKKAKLDVSVRCTENIAQDFRTLAPFISRLAGVGQLECGADVTKPPQAGSYVNPEFEAYVSLRGLIDVPAEIKRAEKELAEKRKHLQSVQAKLGNANFTGRAPAEVVEQQRALAADLEKQIRALEENLQELRQG
ncbi:MAG TPA: class I tRNA ligase family protein, partial [Gemmataceae bacterium]|nr:class I tRNA ligase family protein [Gemmataceae bacterium]